MEKLNFICPQCLYITEKNGRLEDLEDIVRCPICDTPMRLNVDEDLLDTAISMDILTIMQHHIATLGSKRCWELIEDFKFPEMRLKYRKLFFDAGGKIPERKEIK